MMKFRLFGVVCALVINATPLQSHAALVGVLPETPGGTDYQAYYDNVADLTWLANANSAGGLRSWADAMARVDALNINGVTGWRLPDTLQPDSSCSYPYYWAGSAGLYCTGSEMGNLFYNVLGGTSHNSNYDLFSNIQPFLYWSATEVAFYPYEAWYFDFGIGAQFSYYKTYPGYAWAVHSGNAGAVPLPPALYLFAFGLLGLLFIARKKAA